MKAITVKFLRQYRAQGTGTPTFVYTIEGSAEDRAYYEANVDPAFLRHDSESFNGSMPTNKPLFFTTRPSLEDTAEIVQTGTGWIIDSGELDRLAAVVTGYGGNMGSEMAQAYLAKRIGNGTRSRTAPAIQPAANTTGATAGNEGDGTLNQPK